MHKLLSDAEAAEIRRKPLMADKHFAMRAFDRVDFAKVLQIMAEGRIYQEGKDKYRAVMFLKGGKRAFVLFRSHPDYNEMLTVGVTSKKGDRYG